MMRNTLVHRRALLALLLAPLALPLTGCVLAAGAVGGAIISQEVLDDNAVETHLDRPVRDVWPIVKTFVSRNSTDLIEVDEDHMMARGNVYASKVTVKVYGFDERRTVLLVSAKKAGFNDGDAALQVSKKITARVNE